MVYLDNAATAKYTNIDDIIVDTMTTAMRDSWLNPSSLYAANVKNKIDKCRENIANFINAKSEEIIFTSGASESNNMAIRGWVDNLWEIGNVITSTIEHKSTVNLVQSNILEARVYDCKVDKHGIIDYQDLNTYLSYYKYIPTLVSIHMANNELGVIQDIKRISEMVHRHYDGILHVDATQALPYIPIDVEALGIDMLSASGHKISPVLKGIGFLYKRNGVNIKPLIYGAQENNLRGGTENTFGIIGLSKAIEYCDTTIQITESLCGKRDYFIDRLVKKFGCKLNGHATNRLPNNVNVTFPQDITGEGLLYLLDMSDIKCSTGSACNSHDIQMSHVLEAIGLTKEDAMKTVRFTLPNDITHQDIDKVIDEIEKAITLIEIN